MYGVEKPRKSAEKFSLKKRCFLSCNFPGGARRPEADRDVPPGGRQAVHYGVVADHQEQGRADPAMAAGRRRLRPGRVDAARPAQDRLRGGRSAPT